MVKKIILILMLINIIVIGVYALFIFKPKDNKNVNVLEVDKVNNYVLYKDDTELYKTYFKLLKDILSSDNIDYKEYAKVVSELFVSDFYNLSNKTSKEDVGGCEFIYSKNVSNFRLKASNTLYKYINVIDELPTIKEVIINDIKEDKYKIDNLEYDAYNIFLNVEYVKDLGYPKDINLTLIKDNDTISIVEIGDNNVK